MFINLYEHTKNYDKSESYYLEALEIYQKLLKKDFKKYQAAIARTENNLGIMYEKKKDYTKSENSYLKALNLRQQLAKTDSSFETDVANTQGDIRVLYEKKNSYSQAIAADLKAFTIYERLALKDSLLQQEAARIQNNLGSLYHNKNDFTNSDISFIYASKVRERLALIDPGMYEKDFFNTQSALMNLYQDMIDSLNNESVKLKYHEVAISFYQKLYKKSLSEKCLLNVDADACGSIAWHLLFLEKFKEAEIAARWGLQIDTGAIWIRTNLAHSLLFQGKYTEAEMEYLTLKEKTDDGNGKLYKVIFLEDFYALEKAGITHQDVKKIKELLKK